MSMRRVAMIPSLLTICNFSCGLLSAVLCVQAMRYFSRAQTLSQLRVDDLSKIFDANQAGEHMLYWACIVIFLAMVFDMFDGQVARMTGSESKFGAELDSLADGCSFGLAPALIVTTLWIRSQPPTAKWYSFAMFAGIAYAACAIVRLARYNVEKSVADKNYFTGLPSPGAAGAIVSAVLFCLNGHLKFLWDWMAETIPVVRPSGETYQPDEMMAKSLGLYLLIIGLLMVTRLRFLHVANKYLGGRRRFTHLVIAIFLFILLLNSPAEFLFVAFNVYVVFCLFAFNLLPRGRRTSPTRPAGPSETETNVPITVTTRIQKPLTPIQPNEDQEASDEA